MSELDGFTKACMRAAALTPEEKGRVTDMMIESIGEDCFAALSFSIAMVMVSNLDRWTNAEKPQDAVKMAEAMILTALTTLYFSGNLIIKKKGNSDGSEG